MNTQDKGSRKHFVWRKQTVTYKEKKIHKELDDRRKLNNIFNALIAMKLKFYA